MYATRGDAVRAILSRGRRACTRLAGASVMRASREGAVRARVSGCVCTNVRALIAIEVY